MVMLGAEMAAPGVATAAVVEYHDDCGVWPRVARLLEANLSGGGGLGFRDVKLAIPGGQVRSTTLSWNLCFHGFPLKMFRFCVLDRAQNHGEPAAAGSVSLGPAAGGGSAAAAAPPPAVLAAAAAASAAGAAHATTTVRRLPVRFEPAGGTAAATGQPPAELRALAKPYCALRLVAFADAAQYKSAGAA